MKKQKAIDKIYSVMNEIKNETDRLTEELEACKGKLEEPLDVGTYGQIRHDIGYAEGLIECQKKLLALVEELGLN